MRPSHLFIVGLPRTGTKLIRQIVEGSRSPRCRISGETFFFGRFLRGGVRDEIRRIGDLRDDARLERFLDLVYSGALRGSYWNQCREGRFGRTREALRERLRACPRGEKDVYEVLLRFHPEIDDETVLGDKTPSHLYHVPTLLDWYPEAKIVHALRDPRAIAASEWVRRLEVREAAGAGRGAVRSTVTWAATLAHVVVTWRHAAMLHERYARLHPDRYVAVRFEDLVGEPERAVPTLCDALGLAFEEGMLQPRIAGSSFHRASQPGFHRPTLDHWRRVLSRPAAGAIERLTARGLAQLGYRSARAQQ